MNKIAAIAINTFREAIRDKILYAILFFSLLMLFASLALGELSLGHNIKVMKDLGLSAISMFGILLAIFTGVSLVHKELDKRTIYTLLSKPIHRYQFILGKYLGMLFTAFVQLTILTIIFTLLLLYQQQFIDFNLYSAIFLYWVEIMLITSMALFFSSFTTPFFSGLFTFSFFIIGRLMPDIYQVLTQLKSPVTWIMLKTTTLLPNLQRLNIGPQIVHHEVLRADYLVSASMYAFGYIALFLLFAIVLFNRRDFI